jgi:hypothetical protein
MISYRPMAHASIFNGIIKEVEWFLPPTLHPSYENCKFTGKEDVLLSTICEQGS